MKSMNLKELMGLMTSVLGSDAMADEASLPEDVKVKINDIREASNKKIRTLNGQVDELLKKQTLKIKEYDQTKSEKKQKNLEAELDDLERQIDDLRAKAKDVVDETNTTTENLHKAAKLQATITPLVGMVMGQVNTYWPVVTGILSTHKPSLLAIFNQLYGGIIDIDESTIDTHKRGCKVMAKKLSNQLSILMREGLFTRAEAMQIILQKMAANSAMMKAIDNGMKKNRPAS